MKRRFTARTLFPLTVVAAAVASLSSPAAFAQDNGGCERLSTMVEETGDTPLRDQFSDAQDVAENGEAEACNQYVARVEEAGGLTATDDAEASDTAQASDEEGSGEQTSAETVQVAQDATIEGEVKVTLPDPEVTVEQDPADISVNTSPPEVNVTQGQPTITVRQAQPIIRVTMAQPTISVEQPAPEIIITMPEPGVDVSTAQPEVEVNIPEPRVTVTQGDPQLSVDLETQVGEDATSESNTKIERSDEEGVMKVTAEGLSGDSSEPQVSFNESDEEPSINYEGAEPVVEYESAEPDVKIESEGEPQIDLVESGEPKITIRQSGDEGEGESQQASAEQNEGENTETSSEASNESSGEQRDPQEAFAAAESETLEGASSGVVTVGELDGMPVVNANGEDLGEVERVVRNGNNTYMIVEHGGWFLGLNDKEIALPIGDVTMREGDIVLRGLTEEQIESMPEYNYDNEVALEGEDEVTLQRMN